MTTCSHPSCWSLADYLYPDTVLGTIPRCAAHPLTSVV